MKNTKLPSLIVLMILTAITIVFLVSFSVYRVFTREPAAVVPEETILDLEPKIDKGIIDKANNRL